MHRNNKQKDKYFFAHSLDEMEEWISILRAKGATERPINRSGSVSVHPPAVTPSWNLPRNLPESENGTIPTLTPSDSNNSSIQSSNSSNNNNINHNNSNHTNIKTKGLDFSGAKLSAQVATAGLNMGGKKGETFGVTKKIFEKILLFFYSSHTLFLLLLRDPILPLRVGQFFGDINNLQNYFQQ